ncbi:hypothetical protein [Sphingomonas sp.]|uniref:hypothetical protein n=1 Tax=Sphingomonas sp. TaxID=28214 RepID=UPI002DB5AC2E|nr:hypothetical protein [Sphingomonas sp.]HEU4968519.1 hypothetical protein [Sphingomonas sp.]
MNAGSGPELRVCFPLIAQIHQTYHSLPIALQMALRHPRVEVHVACATREHLDAAQALARDCYPGAHVTFDLLALPSAIRASIPRFGQGIVPKLAVLFGNLGYFGGFDALVVPERTTLLLRPWLRRPKLVWTRHGAGDRARGFERDIRKFDFVLMAGDKIERRLLEQGLIRPGHYVTGVYAKLDLVRCKPHRPLFGNGRPTILYAPHFWRSLSSWPLVGRQVLDFFAASDRYNLIFAPHIRLFYPPTPRKYRAFAAFEGLPHVRIDLGSTASADMSYTLGADLYLGDVSSQVAEFLVRPRPCLFLNPRRTEWRGDPDYRFWELGPVIESAAELGEGIERAFATHADYRAEQAAYACDSFGAALDEETAPRGADATVDFLRRGRNDGNLRARGDFQQAVE